MHVVVLRWLVTRLDHFSGLLLYLLSRSHSIDNIHNVKPGDIWLISIAAHEGLLKLTIVVVVVVLRLLIIVAAFIIIVVVVVAVLLLGDIAAAIVEACMLLLLCMLLLCLLVELGGELLLLGVVQVGQRSYLRLPL